MKNLADKVNVFAATFPKLSKHKNIFDKSCFIARDLIRKAKRFSLDDDFVKLAVYRATKAPHKVLPHTNYAALPFPVVFIEHDWFTRVDAQWQQGAMSTKPEKEPAPRRIGYLMHRSNDEDPTRWIAHKFIETMPFDDDDVRFPVSPFSCAYGFDAKGAPPVSAADDGTQWQDWIGKMPRKLTQLMWGYDQEKFIESGMEADVKALDLMKRMACPTIDPIITEPILRNAKEDVHEKMLERWAADLVESMGDMRFLTTALAMINVVPVSYKHVPATGTYQKRLKNYPYLDHSTITIEAGRRKVITVVDQAFKKAERARHRAHNVRGFYRTYHKNTPDEIKVWVKEHVRGDATLGWVRQEYEVTLPD
jgi:hypothetical protein